MAVHLRLARHGSTHKPFYHVVAADARMARDGRFIEKLGVYDPQSNPSTIKLDVERMQYWYGEGAVLSSAVDKLLKAEKVTLSRKKA